MEHWEPVTSSARPDGSARWAAPFATGVVGALLILSLPPCLADARAAEATSLEAKANRLFHRKGKATAERFTLVKSTHAFDVVNPGTSFMMLQFEPNTNASLVPEVVRLGPGMRQTVTMAIHPGTRSFVLSYAVARATTPFSSHTNRYRAYNDGETVQCVPVAPDLQTAMRDRTVSILNDSKVLVTDPNTPPGTHVYTPGPFYKAAGLFARDFLYQLEGAGRYATSDEVRSAVDYLSARQLTNNVKVGSFTYPKGAIPDHVYPDGRYCWGPGQFYGSDTAHFNRPSMDEAMCFITLAWHYGFKAGWDAAWRDWFKPMAPRFADAWNSVPLNPKTGLVTQWTTPGHVGGSGITETNGACVMWGFHDSYGFPGDDLGTSVLACNAARALGDMHHHAGAAASAHTWSVTADSMRDAIRAQFNPAGYLPWGVGPGAPFIASPDITGYAVWSGILTDAQADAASDWLCARYRADRATGGAADLFQMTASLRGAVRMARKADDVNPGSHVWPHVPAGHWENLAYGYNAYQDGGYWYYMSLGIAKTLWRKHPAEAREWVVNTYADMAAGDAHHPYERIDGVTPVNDRYNASAGPLLGMGMPAVVSSVTVTVKTKTL